MMSARPKPLHLLCGRPMVLHVIDALAELHVDRVVVVVGHGAEQVVKTLTEEAPPDVEITFVEQHSQRGTGDAVSVGITALPDADDEDGDVLVMPGDTPLLRPATIAALVRAHRAADAAATLLTAEVGDPYGYGRIVRSRDGRVSTRGRRGGRHARGTRAHRDQHVDLRVPSRSPGSGPAAHQPRQCQGRVLPDRRRRASSHDAGYNVTALSVADPMEAAGVNDRAQLAVAEAELRDRTNERWMRKGVTMVDPEHTYIDASVVLGTDVTLFPDTILQGRTVIGAHAQIGPSTRLEDCTVGDGSIVENTVACRSTIGENARVGPFASLGPGSSVADATATGPFFTVG